MRATFDADSLAQLGDLIGQATCELHQVVEDLADLPVQAGAIIGQAHVELTAAQRAQCGQELTAVERFFGVTVAGRRTARMCFGHYSSLKDRACCSASTLAGLTMCRSNPASIARRLSLS